MEHNQVNKSQNVTFVQEAEKPKKKKILWVTVLTVATIAFIAGFAWYYSSVYTSTTCVPSSSQNNQTDNTAVEKPPADFQSIDLNGTTVHYPSAWGNPKKATIIENINKEIIPDFASEVASFDAIKGEEAYLTVTDAASYEKNEEANKVVQALKLIYDRGEIIPEPLLKSNALLPPANAGLAKYVIRYAESANKDWRGYWLLGTIGQDINANVHFISAMYSKNTGKIFSVNKSMTSKMSAALEKKIIDSTTDEQFGIVEHELTLYTQGLYTDDPELKTEVDNTLLNVLKFTQKSLAIPQ